jgi:tetratricopeptide (TPR) repeat protein
MSRQLLQANPGAPVAAVRLAIALGREGRYREALDAFDEAAGSPYYEAAGVGVHADVLRGVGRCGEAAELRLSAARVARDPAALYVGAIDDRVACGDLAGAEDVVWEALAATDDAAPVLAAWSTVLELQGRAADAEIERDLAEREAPDDPRVALERARASVSARDWFDAGQDLRPVVVELGRRRDPAAFALVQAWQVGAGQWLQAVQLCSKPTWSVHEDPLVADTCRAVLTRPSQLVRTADTHAADGPFRGLPR